MYYKKLTPEIIKMMVDDVSWCKGILKKVKHSKINFVDVG